MLFLSPESSVIMLAKYIIRSQDKDKVLSATYNFGNGLMH